MSAAISTTAAAPSFSGDALPAVTVPVGSNTGLSDASFSSDVSARGPSSLSTVRSRQTSPSNTLVLTGTISSLKAPRSCAATAFWWLANANAS